MGPDAAHDPGRTAVSRSRPAPSRRRPARISLRVSRQETGAARLRFLVSGLSQERARVARGGSRIQGQSADPDRGDRPGAAPRPGATVHAVAADGLAGPGRLVQPARNERGPDHVADRRARRGSRFSVACGGRAGDREVPRRIVRSSTEEQGRARRGLRPGCAEESGDRGRVRRRVAGLRGGAGSLGWRRVARRIDRGVPEGARDPAGRRSGPLPARGRVSHAP